MGLIQMAYNPWGQEVPIHIAWYLLWVALFAGLAFLVVHALWLRLRAKPEAQAAVVQELAACVPPKVLRHSLAARTFHWLMAAAMLTLLVTAFLPKAGVLIAWVNLHWMAGIVLILLIAFHIGHAVLAMDFWSIWPNRADLAELRGPASAKPGKYPLGNKLYHLAIVACGLTMVLTGALLLSRVRTPFFPRDPYLFADMTWGVIYLLHGFAGVGLVALVIVHVYFALRPEKLPVTKAMIYGTMDREYVLSHHDPRQWSCGSAAGK